MQDRSFECFFCGSSISFKWVKTAANNNIYIFFLLQVKSTLNWATSVLHKYVGHRIVYPHFMESYQLQENATESLIEKGTYELTRELEMIENYSLAKSKYLTGTIFWKFYRRKFVG